MLSENRTETPSCRPSLVNQVQKTARKDGGEGMRRRRTWSALSVEGSAWTQDYPEGLFDDFGGTPEGVT
jgi:hypothetical protein